MSDSGLVATTWVPVTSKFTVLLKLTLERGTGGDGQGSSNVQLYGIDLNPDM